MDTYHADEGEIACATDRLTLKLVSAANNRSCTINHLDRRIKAGICSKESARVSLDFEHVVAYKIQCRT